MAITTAIVGSRRMMSDGLAPPDERTMSTIYTATSVLTVVPAMSGDPGLYAMA